MCGLVVQPAAGYLSDNSYSKFGKRRPFLVVGVVGVVVSMIALAWIREMLQWLAFTLGWTEHSVESLLMFSAIILVWILNIAIQPVQMVMRVIVIEHCPYGQQARATAMASYWTGAGSILGYVCGFIDLPFVFGVPFLSQFQLLCLPAALSLVVTSAIACYTIREDQESTMPDSGRAKSSATGFAKQLWKAHRSMTPRLRLTCHIQFYSWMAWFPFLYYGARYDL
jgi:solute carrier family 45 protein 1/2/4